MNSDWLEQPNWRPVVEMVPSYATTSVDDVVDLMSSFDIGLDQHQRYILTGGSAEREDGRWAATRVGVVEPRQNGKSYTLLARTLAGVLLYKERRIIHSAHEVKTALEAFRILENLCMDVPALERRVKRVSHVNGREGIEFMDPRTGRTTSLVSYLARSVGSGRGYSADAILLDEVQELSDDVFSAIVPTVSARPNTQIWLCGTPPGPRMNGAVITRFRQRAHDGTGERLAWYEWGLQADPGDQGFDYSDRRLWARLNPAHPARISMESMADEYESMDEETFRRERLGEWENSSTATVIPLPVWSRQASPGGASRVAKTLAIDVSSTRGASAVTLAGFTDETKRNRYVEVLASGPGVDWLGPFCKDLVENNTDIRAIVVDDASPAGALVNSFKQFYNLTLTPINAKEMARACGQAYDGFVDGTIFHSDQEVLTAAMVGSKKRDLVDAWGLTRRRSEVDIQAFVGAVLALYGTMAPKVKRPVRGARGRRKVAVS